ncbi:class I SAM-dependent RNA methyltransferase [candidate division WOR-3 bacterium]|nr:class I SAM-dependent RNA methyltransferase [candidate division WOR-3 bacterium]
MPFSAPGDVVKVECKGKNDYELCKIVKILEPSPDRVEPKCPHFGLCGGCTFQHIKREKELLYKLSIVKETINRIGKFNIDIDEIITDKDSHYRNKVEYSFFRRKPSFYSVDNKPFAIKECIIEDSLIESVRKKISDMGGVKKLILRRDARSKVFGIIKGVRKQRDNVEKLKRAGVDVIIAPGNKWTGEDFLEYEVGDLKLIVSPFSFFQVNTGMIEKMAVVVSDFIQPEKQDIILDAFSGVGTFGLFLARYVKKTVLVESNEYAFKDSIYNKKRNFIENVNSILSPVEKFRDYRYINKVIIDPPREGIGRAFMEMIDNSNIEKMVYISCNPATLSRDMSFLKRLRPKRIMLFDLFPMTYHIETVVLLTP